MDVPVPPAFVAYDSKKQQSGALIEWFLYSGRLFTHEDYVPGGDYCQQYIVNFDRKKGRQHNFKTVSQIFTDLQIKNSNFNTDWKTYWAKAFIFDALIGNTDRHQDNWGIIIPTLLFKGEKTPASEKMRIYPVFDNGTSMGHEISPDKFKSYENSKYLEKYVCKGWHHMKWDIKDTSHANHIELIKKIAIEYPESRQVMQLCLKKVNNEIFNEIIGNLVKFNVPVRLSAERAAFMLRLLQFRHNRLLKELER